MLWYKKPLKLLVMVSVVWMNIAVLHAQNITAKDTIITVQDTAVSNIVNKVEKYTFILKQTNTSVTRTVKIGPLFKELIPIQQKVSRFQTVIDSAKQLNLRSLNTLSILVKEYSDELNDYKETLTQYSDRLKQSNDTISKIANDTTLDDVIAADSSLTKQISSLRRRAIRMDSVQKNTLAKVTVLRNKVSLTLLQARDMISTLSFRTMTVKRNMWHEEDLPLLSDRFSNYDQSIFQLINSSMSRTGIITQVYLASQWSLLSIALLVFIIVILWTWLNMRRVKKLPEAGDVLAQIHILKPRNIVLGGLMGFFICLPFFFNDPPMTVVHSCEFYRTILLSIIIFPHLSKQSKRSWGVLCVLWLIYSMDDLFIDSALSERWLLFVSAIVYAWLCIKIIRNKEASFMNRTASPVTKFLAVFCLAQIIFSIFFNLTGRITLTKIMGVSAIECLMLGITLKIFCSMILEAVYLQSEAYHESRFSEYINYHVLESKYKRILWIFAVVVWLVSLIRDWTLYDTVLQSITFLFTKHRSIGEYKFSFGDIVMFVGIIWISVIISRMINFFFGQNEASDPSKRKSLASMMLLIRLAIWAVGFLIAVAAAGIPLNQLTVMLGALSVGIGFGLQNIANNLVSGVILAFERPIQVGDQIEIGGKSGTVKEIGVRSSKLSSGSGADIIIPNGDLLSQQLTNWTMKDLTKSVDFKIGIAYTSDIAKVR
ncbi:MAG TPA: mechanosensitive ion channel domain-containing protein, partial [Arachidicoccus sp.]